jgi:hypothetical protein
MGASSLPVLPLTLQPAPPSQEPAQPVRDSEKLPANTSGSATSPPARLRGRIYDHAKRQTIVLFELNGTLLRASNEPNAEWRIVRIAPRQITVRNGEQTLILEVPYAP